MSTERERARERELLLLARKFITYELDPKDCDMFPLIAHLSKRGTTLRRDLPTAAFLSNRLLGRLPYCFEVVWLLAEPSIIGGQ